MPRPIKCEHCQRNDGSHHPTCPNNPAFAVQTRAVLQDRLDALDKALCGLGAREFKSRILVDLIAAARAVVAP